MSSWFGQLGCVSLGLLVVVGCSTKSRFAPVDGLVRVDGKPLQNALVTFIPDDAKSTLNVRSFGMTNSSGQFTLHTEDGTPGALLASHRVIVEDLSINSAPRGPDGTLLRPPPQRFAPQFSDPLRTPLRADVHLENQTIEIELTNR